MKYLIGQLIGKGNSGYVYKGVEEETGKEVIIKHALMQEKVLYRLQREVFISKYLGHHKNLANITDLIVDNGNIYVISEYIANTITLDRWKIPDLAKREGLLILLDVMYNLVEAFLHIHKRGVVHRDIKLENILMKGNIPIVIDWDLSCLHVDDSPYPCRGYVGTPLYVAPEVWKKKVTNPFLTDIYSLGVVFYNLANNKSYPYSGETEEEIIDAMFFAQPDYSDSGNRDLDELIMAMISIDPEYRPSLRNIQEQLNALIKSI